jgi:hypothetical protein
MAGVLLRLGLQIAFAPFSTIQYFGVWYSSSFACRSEIESLCYANVIIDPGATDGWR